MRFDMRVPDWAGSAAAHYSAVLDMCEWAETRGAALSVLSEHHGADDGHLPTPLILASAVAARTQEMAILLAAVPLPLWDPVRLAEEIGKPLQCFGITRDGHPRHPLYLPRDCSLSPWNPRSNTPRRGLVLS